MGNNASLEGGGVASRPPRTFGRTTGALGLSRKELDERCKPSGLYPSCQWDERTIRRLIGDGRLAGRQKGSDTRESVGDRECPICFLQYSQINVTKCCSANVCTECYLQVRPQKERNCSCPFCNQPKLHVTVAGKMDAYAVQEREAEEQRVIEATIRARADTGATCETETSAEPDSPGGSGFGASLEQNSRVQLLRARSESLSSADPDAMSEDQVLSTLAMTVDERRALEEEMRAQHRHPLALRIEQEAEERRIENERSYYRSNSNRIREARAAEFLRSRIMASSRRPSSNRTTLGDGLLASRGRGSRNWNEIVEAFENGGHGEIQSIDDLVVLEAAILLSMEEEARRRSDESETTQPFDAARHARDGFPLVERFLSSRMRDNDESSETTSNSADLADSLQDLAHRMSSRRQQFNRALSSPMFPSGSLRGVSEAEQIEMAIALSLQEAQAATSDTENDETADAGEAVDTEPSSGQTASPQPRGGISSRTDAESANESDTVEEAASLMETIVFSHSGTEEHDGDEAAEEGREVSGRSNEQPLFADSTLRNTSHLNQPVFTLVADGTMHDTATQALADGQGTSSPGDATDGAQG